MDSIFLEYALISKTVVWVLTWGTVGFCLKQFFRIVEKDGIIDPSVQERQNRELNHSTESGRLVVSLFNGFFSKRLFSLRGIIAVLGLTTLAFLSCFYLFLPTMIHSLSQWPGTASALVWGIGILFLFCYGLLFQVRWFLTINAWVLLKFLLSLGLTLIWMMVLILGFAVIVGEPITSYLFKDFWWVLQGNGAPIHTIWLRAFLVVVLIPSLWILLQMLVYWVLAMISVLNTHALLNKEKPFSVLGWVLWACSVMFAVITLPLFLIWL